MAQVRGDGYIPQTGKPRRNAGFPTYQPFWHSNLKTQLSRSISVCIEINADAIKRLNEVFIDARTRAERIVDTETLQYEREITEEYIGELGALDEATKNRIRTRVSDRRANTLSRIRGPRYSIKCSDDSEITNMNVDELLLFHNSAGRYIKAIKIELATPSDLAVIVQIGRWFGQWQKLVTYNISGSDDDVLILGRKIDDWIASIKTSYHYLAKIDWPAIPLSAFGLWLGLLGGGAVYVGLPVAGALRSVLIYSGPMIFLSGPIYIFLRRFLFPDIIFALGEQGMRRAETYRRRRGFIGGTIVVGGLLGYLINVLSK